MKNIHVIQTDKPSRLTIIENKLLLSHVVNWESKPVDWEQGDGVNQNIYITNDEEIKEGDWHLKLLNKTISNYPLNSINPNKGRYKKVILTTDPTLIADGVQAIDDEFLEWFVNNSSCEEVDVKNPFIANVSDFGYKIIIPKEEPKQETLEDAQYNHCPTGTYSKYTAQESFRAGAKWQAKRMYSEKKVKKLCSKAWLKTPNTPNMLENFDKWFEQFKKK